MSPIVICIALFVVMLVLFFTNKIPMSFTALAAMVALVLFGCLDSSAAIATFGSNTVITMASMFVVAAGLTRTQMINNVTRLLYKVTEGSFTKVLASYVVITCIIGQFVPSIVAIFALVHPLVQNMCDRMNISPSKMMYPIAIAMAFELATYGAVAGFMYRKVQHTLPMIYATLVTSMVAGRLVWGAVRFVLAGLSGSSFPFSAFLSGAVLTAVPGIVAQLILIPLIVAALQKAKLTA